MFHPGMRKTLNVAPLPTLFYYYTTCCLPRSTATTAAVPVCDRREKRQLQYLRSHAPLYYKHWTQFIQAE